ncbi:hypothetical protein PR202_ga30213 [Eleusine coracana subsp. coracana]|uniref:Uncharacterized protein n=1 Tax=Eleusine coracana subsp. coracana TaxID=191504 RepID=A0AAV5DNB9_ELECO|nr:hypothetical protein PR202_ga30213 [Eleusine coracana subsp. coracana]
MFIMTKWEIWKQRNGKIFWNTTPSFQAWKDSLVATAKLQMYTLKDSDRSTVQNWLEGLS